MYSLVKKSKLSVYKFWAYNGLIHRKKGPAVEWSDGNKQWWIDGERYFLQENGTKEFYSVGVLHRNTGAAVEYSNGDKEYWYKGKRHRLNGPAVIIGNKKFWFKFGEFIKCTF